MKKFFSRKNISLWLVGRRKKTSATSHKGFLVFSSTGEVIKAQQVLEKASIPLQIKGPPSHMLTGCDMVIEFSLIEEPLIRNILSDNSLVPLDVIPVIDRLIEPVSLFRVTDYGQWIMVRAANMKITVEKETRLIVNISGGGCPDVPYLAGLLVNRYLDEVEVPKSHAKTLCGYALQMAYEEMVRQCAG